MPAQDAVVQAKDTVQAKAADVTETAQNTVADLRTAASERTEQVRAVAGERAEQAKAVAGERAEQAKHAADEKSTQAGAQLTGLASTLRERATELDEASPLAAAASRTAEVLDTTGTYLQATTPDDWGDDLRRVIERRPIAAVLIAAALGWIFSRTFGGNGRTVIIHRDITDTAPAVVPPEA